VEEKKSELSGRKKLRNFVISELTGDGQMVIRRFFPSNETQELNTLRSLSLDSDDRVFVADSGYGRVILLDSDLQWNRILCSTIQGPKRLCYDEEKKQMIVADNYGVSVYTLSRK